MALNVQTLPAPGYEEVIRAVDISVGLTAIIAVHNTNRGPSCGGVRMLPYASESEALEDVLRLSKGMSYKSALADIGFGGGKSVIILDPAKKSIPLFHAFGDFVDSLNGKYIAVKDMNIDSQDLLRIKDNTKHVLGIEGVPGSSGDPSPVTAHGVFYALKTTVKEIWRTDSLEGMRVALQGIGHVGYGVAERLHRSGAKLTVTDTNPKILEKAKRELNASIVELEAIYEVPCDIFSPNARGAILNEKTIPRLKCQAVVGAANNQLATPQDGYRLYERGILYAPDYAINSGGIINIYVEFGGYDEKKAYQKAEAIGGTLQEIYTRAKSEKKPPFVIADKIAEERLGL